MSSSIDAGDSTGNSQVVAFPGGDEERARRLKVEVERLARLSLTEWLYYISLPGYPEKYGVDAATLKTMVEAVIKDIEKKVKEDGGELHRREKRVARGSQGFRASGARGVQGVRAPGTRSQEGS